MQVPSSARRFVLAKGHHRLKGLRTGAAAAVPFKAHVKVPIGKGARYPHKKVPRITRAHSRNAQTLHLLLQDGKADLLRIEYGASGLAKVPT